MPRANPSITNFSAGEFSPTLFGRTDLSKYYSACEKLENMITLPHGPAFRRPGTYFVREVIGRDHVTNGGFDTNTDWIKGTGWTILDGKAVGAAGTAHFIYQNTGDLVEGEIYEFTFTLLDRTAGTVRPHLGGLSGTWRTANNTYTERITCGTNNNAGIYKSADFDGKIDDISVRKIAPKTRLESFQFSTVQAYILEFTDKNLRIYKDNGIILDGDDPYEVVTPYAEDDLFELQMTQSADIMWIWHKGYPEYQLSRTGHTSWTVTKTDYANGPWEDEATTTAIDPDAMTGSLTLTSTDDLFATTDAGRYISIKCSDDKWYYLLITAYTNAKVVTATVKSADLPDHVAVTSYKFGTFCDELGYPSCGDFYEERLLRAGSTKYPQTIWASKSGDYDNMEVGTNDDDGFVYTIAAKGVNAIQWIVPQNTLLIGTKGAEWKMGSSGTDEPISVSNVFVKRQSTWGSKEMQALLVNDVVLFVQRAGTKIRELTEDPMSISAKYIAPDLTILAEHITKGGIIDMAYQQEPTAIVWCVRSDGVLLGLTYERTQEVVGWHRHLTYEGLDFFESVAVNTTTGEDEVWVCVQREIEGETRRYIEYFKPWDWGSDRKDVFFVDSGLSSNHGDAVNITGATKADPVVVTATTDLDDDDKVCIVGVKGMVEINENIYIVASKTGTTFELKDLDGNDIDGSEFTEYVSGGTVQQVAKTYSGLSHLAGRTVSVVGDGSVMPSVEVPTSGEVTLSDYVNKVHIGLGYISKIQPMNIEAGAVAGTAQGKVKKIHKCTVRLKDTMACKMGTCDDDLEEILFRGDKDAADEPIPLFTGDKNINAFPGNFDTNGTVLITCDVPLPMTIVSIMPEFSLKDLL